MTTVEEDFCSSKNESPLYVHMYICIPDHINMYVHTYVC